MDKRCNYCQPDDGDFTEPLFCLSVDMKYPFSFENKKKELSINGVATPTVSVALHVFDGNLECYIDDPYGEASQYEGYDYFGDGTLINEKRYVEVEHKINFCPICGRKLREV